MVEIVPSDVVRQLALHEKLTVRSGRQGHVSLERCAIAPFEDCIFLFLSERSATVASLKTRTWLEGTCRDEDAGWSIRLTGRAVAGRPVISHARRLELLPWLPEDADARRMLAVPFWPEEIEYVRIGKSGESERYYGKTPAGLKLPSFWARWGRLAFRRIEHVVFAALSADWIYLAWLGHETPLRWVALALAGSASVLMLGGARMIYRTLAFNAWREGRCDPDDAPLLTGGLVAPTPAFQLGVAMLVLGLALVLPLNMWGPTLAWVALSGTWLWLLGPIWFIHLSQEEPEKD
jgi:hypothetical protein